MNDTYCYVFVKNDGSVRELSILEKIYLNTIYSGADGERPYIKSKYIDKDGSGSMSGFCPRNKIPKETKIEEYNIVFSREQIKDQITRIHDIGYNIDWNGIEYLKEYE